MFCKLIILIHIFDHVDLECEPQRGLSRNGLQDLTKYTYGGSDKENFLPAMKGLTNQPKWLVFFWDEKEKRKAATPSASLVTLMCALDQQNHQLRRLLINIDRPGVPPRGAYSLVFLPGSYRKVLFQAGHGSFTSCHIQRVFLIL